MQEEFDRLHNKRIKCLGNHFPHFKEKEGICTAALFDDMLVAIMMDGYDPDERPGYWINFFLDKKKYKEQLKDFVVVE